MGGTHKCGLYLQSESCALPDVLNRAAVIRNEQIRIQIFGSAPDPSKKRSRVTVASAASQPTRVQPSRAAKCMPSLPVAVDDWSCFGDCRVRSKDVACFLAHLLDVHKLVLNSEHLAPLGLGLCPFCSGVFAARRGLVTHLRLCTHPRKLLCDLVEGPFPRWCKVWWQVFLSGKCCTGLCRETG
jgi:hypothetical protein